MKTLPALLLATLPPLFFSPTSWATDTSTARVLNVEGGAWVLASGSNPRQALAKDSTILAGSTVETDAKGSLRLVWDTPTHTRVGLWLRANSRLKLRAGAGKIPPEALLEKGQLMTLAIPPPHPTSEVGARFFVRSRAVTIGVRGTNFYTKNIAGQPVYFCPCHGKMQVGETLFESKHHDAPQLINDRGLMTPAKAPPEHSDEEAALLESEIRGA